MRIRGRQEQDSSSYYSEEQTRRVLETCGINIEYEIESDYIVYCPYHNNYRTPAAEVSKTTGQFYCFGCQESKSLTELVMYSSKRTFFESTRMIHSKASIKNIVSDIDELLGKKEQDFVEFDKDLIITLNSAALNSSRAATYLKGRGIKKESVERFLLGYSEKQDMVTVPITAPDGRYIGFVARSIEGKDFKNSIGLLKSKTMFNLSSSKRYDKVFVVESSFDAIRLEQVGVHAIATLGATVSKHQKELLKRYFRSIILLSDNDEAGRGMREKLKVYLNSSLITADLPEDVKDVSDMDDQRLSEFVSKFDDELSYILQ
jgi:DNA primase